MKNVLFVFAGMIFGIVMVKSEAVSWFRIQEMFHFQAFHMYGIILSAIATSALLLTVLKQIGLKDVNGQIIQKPSKTKLIISPLLGGIIFGLGWSMTGACPGPLFVNLGAGYTIFIVPIAFAVLGAFVHGLVRKYLPL
ncbi:MAG: YeeE/YedE family protein [Flavobacteriales bacterium]|nr:YeeE/YedE family protein [Flavobacteriales bacterium]MCB9190611.1 YeeE/YedE family protein [Flavobacteriales bacterium]MCB9205557.1 YeeE/YedE family protein [Flavobacteriales bacterium]